MSTPPDKTFDLEVRLLLEAIYERYCYDFRGYSMASLRRRLAQAMNRLGVSSPSELQHLALRDQAAFADLLATLTVHVTDLFRDPSYFQALRTEVVPHLATYPSLKIWVAGCSTGEEVYSLAILLEEEHLLDRTILYASDIDPQALRTAERGVYALDRAAAFSHNYRAAGGRGSLSDYYTADYAAIRFDRSLVKHVLFTDHSLATDGVFAEVHLISCRNVLIYFDRPLQDRALELFREALVRNGFLGLGSKETLRFSSVAESFSEFVGEQRIFRKRTA